MLNECSNSATRDLTSRGHDIIAPYIRQTPIRQASGSDDIVHAQDVLWDVFRLVIEPGEAAAFAAILARQYNPSSDEHVVVVLCGGNAQR